MASIGEYLMQKVDNMVDWLEDNALDVPYEASRIPQVFIVRMAEELAAHRDIVEARDFKGLMDMQDLPAQIKDLTVQVQGREELHDKFWRYLSLFIELVSI